MAHVKQHKRVPPADGPAQPQETKMEATPSQAAPEVNPETAPVQSAPTAAVYVPEYPKDLYDEAHIENGHRAFNDRLMAVRAPNGGKPAYVPPAPPAAVATQTELEMAAGAKRVSHFQEQEAARKEQVAARVHEKWEGKTTAVFRPPAFTEYSATFKSPAQTPSKDNLRAPFQRR